MRKIVLLTIIILAVMAAGCTMTNKSSTEVFDDGSDPTIVALRWIEENNVTIDPGSLNVPIHSSAMTREDNGVLIYWVYSHDYRFAFTSNGTPTYIDITVYGTPYTGEWHVSYAMQDAHWDLIWGKDINAELAERPPAPTPTPIPTPDPLGRGPKVTP
jgi:hypothetical protein